MTETTLTVRGGNDPETMAAALRLAIDGVMDIHEIAPGRLLVVRMVDGRAVAQECLVGFNTGPSETRWTFTLVPPIGPA